MTEDIAMNLLEPLNTLIIHNDKVMINIWLLVTDLGSLQLVQKANLMQGKTHENIKMGL
jgi:hypothetical protein